MNRRIITIALLFSIIVPCTDLLSASGQYPFEKIKKEKIDNYKTVTMWLGGGFGVRFVSDDMHSYLKRHVSSNAIKLYFSLSAKMLFDIRPVKWLNFELVGEASSSGNYTHFFYEMIPYSRFSGGMLAGYVFTSYDTLYMVSGGALYHYMFFSGESADALGFRVKLTMLPFVNYLTKFPTVRGFINADYAYSNGSGMTLGSWGFQVGAEFKIF